MIFRRSVPVNVFVSPQNVAFFLTLTLHVDLKTVWQHVSLHLNEVLSRIYDVVDVVVEEGVEENYREWVN